MSGLIHVNTMVRRILALRPPTKLGRWEHRQTSKQLEIKLTWANIENCGDQLCGNPWQIRQDSDAIFKEHIPYGSKNFNK